MRKVELLMPAGNLEKLEYAVKYGADAVYLGVVDFSLRAMRKGELITFDNLKAAVDLAHSLGARAYVTINIFAFNNDIDNLKKCIHKFKEANPDAIILSDMGIFNIVKEYMPETPIHISTQANSLNYETVKLWADLGAKRVILARELPIADVKRIKQENPNVELEVFIHGSQCVSFSGRCLLSDYMTDNERQANQGNCAQPCRWSYKLVEETRPNQEFTIAETERGTHILSPKDLCLVEYLPKLIEAGVDSLKVEGRTKSLYYVSAVAKTYRNAIDKAFENHSADLTEYKQELKKVGNRGYTTGFYLGEHAQDAYSYDISNGLAGADFLCEFKNKQEDEFYLVKIKNKKEDDFYLVKIKNKINLNDEIEIITPVEQFQTKVLDIRNDKGLAVEVANTNDEIWIKFDKKIEDFKYAIART